MPAPRRVTVSAAQFRFPTHALWDWLLTLGWGSWIMCCLIQRLQNRTAGSESLGRGGGKLSGSDHWVIKKKDAEAEIGRDGTAAVPKYLSPFLLPSYQLYFAAHTPVLSLPGVPDSS